MAKTLSAVRRQELGELRIEPSPKRVRANLGGRTLLDTRRALLVWEPRRVVPGYAVPVEDVLGAISDDTTAPPDAAAIAAANAQPVWDPRVPFDIRTTPGRAVLLRAGEGEGGGAGEEHGTAEGQVRGFIADDPDLDGYVIVDFAGVDGWREDEDEIISHPHDPFSRIDIRSTDRHLVFASHGVTIADTRRAKVLYETGLPVRYYLPRDDVLVELRPSDTVTTCAYKGFASYYSPVVRGEVLPDLAWSYPDPLIDAHDVAGLIAFFDEKLDLTIDGVPRERPDTPWS